MPKAIERKLRKQFKKKGLTGDKLNNAIYGTLNKMGFMKGSKVIKK